MKKGLFSYENGIVLLMALTFGCLFFDRLALNFLMPYVAKDLNLDDTQIGLLAGGLSLAWAFSSFFTTAWAETNDKKKLVFVASVFVFSLCSFGAGIAASFAVLLVARLVMGFAEGPVIPLAQSFVERESSPNRLGFNSGMLQALGSALFGSILAPVLLVKIADTEGWRNAFFIAGAPGFLMGLIAYFYLKPSTTESRGEQNEQKTLNIAELLQYNNIKWGIPAACCVMGWWFATLPFISNYFVKNQGMSTDDMGKTMGLLGVSGLLFSIFIPAISDKIGRKKALFGAVAVGIFYPFAVKFLAGSGLQLPAMFLTYCTMGAMPLVAAVIPSEAVPVHLKAKGIGLITAISEIIGGVLVSIVAGVLSDKVDPSAFLWVSAALAALGLFFISKLE